MDNTIVITGGCSGIGLLMTKTYLNSNDKVIVLDINEKAGKDLSKELGENFTFIKVDVGDEKSVQKAVSKIEKVDILINNAGIVNGKSFMELSDREVRRTFDVNVFSLFNVTKQILPKMNNKGNIVIVASAAGFFGLSKQIDYSASKFAAIGFAESLRNELKKSKSKIKVLTVCPYYINTGMFEGVKTRVPFLLPILKQEYVAKKIVKSIKKGRQQLIMPRFVYIAPLVKILPTPLSLFVLNLFGLNSSMDEFKGRNKNAYKK